jgi:Na+-translocating ferredoxin:NAD+ oxidoreductase RnfD subunit
MSELAVFVAITFIVGAFVMAPEAVTSAIEDTAQALTGGGGG